jgi:hypothetical protein
MEQRSPCFDCPSGEDRTICARKCDRLKKYREYLSDIHGDIEFVAKGGRDVLYGKYPGLKKEVDKAIVISEDNRRG